MARRTIPQRLVPLKEAPWHFAPQRLKRELDRVRSLPSQPIPVQKTEDGLEAFLMMVRGFQALSEDSRKRNKPFWEMQEVLRQRLYAGKLDAFGIKTKPEPGKGPQKIEPFIFKDNPKINWGKNTVENFGQKFEGIEVSRRTVARQISPPPIDESKETGRPSKAPEIMNAIQSLVAKGIDLNAMPRALAYDKIRRFAEEELGLNTRIGYSDPVIQRCLIRSVGKRR
jgi:hypothetical protein